MSETYHQRMLTAVKSSDPVERLLEIARSAKANGVSQLALYQLFTRFLEQIDPWASEAQCDATRDVLDYIYGWCGPSHRLYGTILEPGDVDPPSSSDRSHSPD